jgi:hypothetical protein
MDVHISLTTLVFLCVGISCAVISSFLFWQEIGEVNRKLPENEQISYLGMYPQKYTRIKREYKRLYPNGRIHRMGFVFEVVGFVFLFLAAVSAGFFNHWLAK